MLKDIMLVVLFVASVLFGRYCLADNSVPPSYLKDATITVTLKDGKTYTYSANEYMVVKRGQKVIAPAPVDSTPYPEQPGIAPTPVAERHKNIVSIEGVYGQNGMDLNRTGSTYELKEKKEFGLGLQLQHNFTSDYYGGVRVDTNGNVGVSVGRGL